jgi:hypothetical protein
MNGGTLAQWVREHGAMGVADALRVATALADALAEAHSVGIIHRDLKPQNILFANVAGSRLPKLADFGIAKWLEDEESSVTLPPQRAGDTEVVAGQDVAMFSPSWAAPEQLAGEAIGTSSDLYSLALLVIYMLTGHAIFADEDVYQGYHKRRNAEALVHGALDPLGLPADAVALLVHATRFAPQERPSSIADFGLALSDAFEPVTANAGALPPPERPILTAAPGPAPVPVPERAAARPTRRLAVTAEPLEVAGRAAQFCPLQGGAVDVAGLGGAVRVRLSFLPDSGGRRHIHVKGMSCFVAKAGGRPTVAVQIDGDAMLDLVNTDNAPAGRIRVTTGAPAAGHTVFRFGDEHVAISTEECPDVIVIDFGQGAECAFVYTPGVLPVADRGRKRRKT